jgi:ABC-2 type transport system permease protein
MLRAIWLTMQNEARLLFVDPIVLFMLLLAPIVIITVAGYSLGSLYGGVASSFHTPVVDLDRGQVSAALINALRANRSLEVEIARDENQARQAVSDRPRTPIAIVIPPGTSIALTQGRTPHLGVYVDPVRRIEVNALELQIGELCRRISERARLEARENLNAAAVLMERFGSSGRYTIPGSLSFTEQSAVDGGPLTVNAFDQYVPGFGITFLLIGMMLGIALTLFDERNWGTLKRLRVSGAPLIGLLMGKLIARFVVGTIQMILLFAVGWALFGISLGREPLALLVPIVGISFASGALGLVISSIAHAHDYVMPLGTVTSMSMAAIGGCWWPLDFEPGWLRSAAKWMPTTWTMEAFNNLMIRKLPLSSVLWPFVATVGLGAIFLVFGTFRLVCLESGWRRQPHAHARARSGILKELFWPR